MIRDDWVTVITSEILDVRDGTHDSPKYISNSNHPLVTSKNLKGGDLDLSNVKYISKNDFNEINKRSKVDIGDVLFAMIGTIGNPVVIKKEPHYSIKNIGLFKNTFKVINSEFLKYFLDSYNLYNQLVKRELLKGTTQKFIPLGHLRKLEIPLPPIPEQQAIIAKIETLFSDLDKGIADLKTAQEQLKIYRQAVLKKAFEGELTKKWREKNIMTSSFEYLTQLSKKRFDNVSDKKSIYHKKISHNFKFKQDNNTPTWSSGTLDKLVYIAARIGWRGLKKSEYTEKGPLFLSVHSLNYGKYVDYSKAFHLSLERYNESPEIQLKEGDVLLCKDGAGIGKIGIIKNLPYKATVNSSLLIIRGMEVLGQEFLYYLFSGPDLQSIVFERITGSATPHLFQNDIRKFELSIPPIEEQHQIVREIETRLSVCDKLEQTITESLEKSNSLRQSILKKAFAGKLLNKAELEKCKQDKDYEPASELLKKIKAENTKQ
ncbi:restriction endonuclease subunit S [Candidatus Venteria ishoeyi]|uniref:Type-1 restriction enzyme EcoKI specificity protein n=1 Tax=Candidatus Venteria ishoeyi TaxID=1899563 RepID=A0A1H6F4I7_9GAMM|nr:restriction endonuclease subunit S [Candidatus Venteria ishoeyi]SEH05078.1 Type-1 restriction enzyme EcoKI specificity protein [Candidatus Venteria ishoeyi]